MILLQAEHVTALDWWIFLKRGINPVCRTGAPHDAELKQELKYLM